MKSGHVFFLPHPVLPITLTYMWLVVSWTVNLCCVYLQILMWWLSVHPLHHKWTWLLSVQWLGRADMGKHLAVCDVPCLKEPRTRIHTATLTESSRWWLDAALHVSDCPVRQHRTAPLQVCNLQAESAQGEWWHHAAGHSGSCQGCHGVAMGLLGRFYECHLDYIRNTRTRHQSPDIGWFVCDRGSGGFDNCAWIRHLRTVKPLYGQWSRIRWWQMYPHMLPLAFCLQHGEI